MRIIACVVAFSVAACTAEQHAPAALAEGFDGANYATPAAQVAHGERLARIFMCAGCHGPDYTGVNFGEMIPIVQGLWATNISLTMPAMSDAQLETLLRKGVHPAREIYLMPSKQTQFLGERDMSALIAHLRSIPPAGTATPPPPPGFEQAVAARLPDDYWRWQDYPGHPRTYHNSEEEADYFARHRAPHAGIGANAVQGRYIAITVCSGCHGAALDGRGEDAGGIQAALRYDDAEYERLLTQSTSRDGRKLVMEWGFGHEVFPLTASERSAVIGYTRELARVRAVGPQGARASGESR